MSKDVTLSYSTVSDNLSTISVEYADGARLEVDVLARNGRVAVSAYPIGGTETSVERVAHNDFASGISEFTLRLTAPKEG